MPIPESQLQTWSNLGATDLPQRTHLSIRKALDSFKGWREPIAYDTYLSGSYINHTNIHANSDVDLVVELTSMHYFNLSTQEMQALKITPVTYDWTHFRQDVIRALTEYYGSSYIDLTGKKSIKLKPAPGRQKADVIVSASYTHYENLKPSAKGIIFWTQPEGYEVINYPKLHKDNGANKNSEYRTRDWYKRTIRTYKNARDRIYANKPHLADQFPSYFIECLLYNVPDREFGGSFESNFVDTLNWLAAELYKDTANEMVCQNEMYYLLRPSLVTWNITDARSFVSELVDLWDDW
jgi:hypothetical protein